MPLRRTPTARLRRRLEALPPFRLEVASPGLGNTLTTDRDEKYVALRADTVDAPHARRSAQTAMWHLAEALCRWIAPILSFTAEEIRAMRAAGVEVLPRLEMLQLVPPRTLAKP